MSMPENEFKLTAEQEHKILYDTGFALTGNEQGARDYHDAVIRSHDFALTPREDGGVIIDLTPGRNTFDALIAQVVFVWKGKVAGGDHEDMDPKPLEFSDDQPPLEGKSVAEVLKEMDREAHRQAQRRFRQRLKGKPEEVQERYRGYKRTYRQKPEVKAAEAERQRRRRAKQEPQDPQVTD